MSCADLRFVASNLSLIETSASDRVEWFTLNQYSTRIILARSSLQTNSAGILGIIASISEIESRCKLFTGKRPEVFTVEVPIVMRLSSWELRTANSRTTLGSWRVYSKGVSLICSSNIPISCFLPSQSQAYSISSIRSYSTDVPQHRMLAAKLFISYDS